MKLEPKDDSSCVYVDHVRLDAGVLTWGVWLFAFFFYRYRQAGWRRLAATLAEPG